MKYWDTLGKSVISTRTFEIMADANTAEFAQEIVRGLESAAQLAAAAQERDALREMLESVEHTCRHAGDLRRAQLCEIADDIRARLLASADGMQGNKV